MSLRKTVLLATISALVLITALHLTFNLHVFSALTGNESFRVGFLPVTCHLTCPVTDFINKQVSGRSEFQPLRFQGWPELKEAFLSGETPATFILAPLAMKLREDGVPLRIVYLGQRYDLVVAGMLMIGLIGLFLDFLIRQLETFDEVKWGYSQRN
jgi:NitT/TauT family transport system substrate-binding protein